MPRKLKPARAKRVGMTPAEFRAIYEKSGQSMLAITLELGLSERQGWRYLSGEQPISPSRAKLIKALLV